VSFALSRRKQLKTFSASSSLTSGALGSKGDEAAEQGDEADEAGASDGASQLIPGVRPTMVSSIRQPEMLSTPEVSGPKTCGSFGDGR
jgi:hypothetical protein